MTKGPRKRKTTCLLGPNLLDMFEKARKAKFGEPDVEPNEESSESENDINDKPVFQYKWLQTWLWMHYDRDKDAVFCKICQAFAVGASKTHMATDEKSINAAKAKKPVVVAVQKMQSSVHGAVENLFRAAYTVAARSWSFNDFEHVIDLIDLVGCPAITKQLYQNDHACHDFVVCIGESLHTTLIEKMKISPFFGIQVDESTDVATQQHLVLCVSYLEYGSEAKHSFLTILRVRKADASTLFDALVEHLKQAGLDMNKLIGFGFDGASTMTGHRTGVAARLKSFYPYMISIHCIAHRTNLALQDAAKESTMSWIEEIEMLVNAIAVHFSRSSKRLEKLQELLEEYACAILRLEGIQSIRWLSMHNAIGKLCEDLPAVLEYSKVESLAIFSKLADFKMIYLLHFLADILGGLTILSKMFQARNIDITSINDHVKTVILAIQTYYIDVPETDLNAYHLDSKGYPIIPDYRPPAGWLEALRSSIHGNEFRSFEIAREMDGTDLENVIAQQKAYAKAICDNLEVRFEDTSILKHFGVLSPLNIPKIAIRSRKFGEESLEELIKFYGMPKKVKGLAEMTTPLINGDDLRREYSDYKLHASANWQHTSLDEVCSIIGSSPANEMRYRNILILLQIGSVQCASNALCESIFSHRTSIKSRWRPLLGDCSLSACLSIVVNGPPRARDFDFTQSIEVWKNKAENRGRIIYSGQPSRYLA